MKMLGILGACALGVLVGVLAVGPSVAEYYAFKNVDPAKREQFKKEYADWKSTKLHLPDEALKPASYSPALQAATRSFAEEWEKHQKQAQKALDNGNAQPDPAVVARALPELAPLLEAFAAVVRQPDYTINAFNQPPQGMVTINYNYYGIQSSAKLLKYQALDLAKHGQMEKALDNAETIVRAGRASRFDNLITQLIGIAITQIGTRTWNDLIHDCGDARLLRRTLEHQNQLAAGLNAFMTRDFPISVVDCVGSLRELNGAGGLDIQYQDMTGREIVARSQEAQVAVWEKALGQVKNDPKKYAQMLQNIQAAQSYSAMMGGRSYTLAGSVKKLGGRFTIPFLFCVSRPNLDEAFTRAEMVRSCFDLLRLETARKLYTLEKGKGPEKMADFTPAYLSEVPADHFAARNAQPDKQETYKETYKESKDAFYSIGPDRKDNLNAIAYDPSNGTYSAGDVALGR